MKIPYDLIHKLEADYGSLDLVPDNNPILHQIHEQIGITARDNIDLTKYEKVVIDFMKDGFNLHDIVAKTGMSFYLVRQIASNYDLQPKPKFRYVAVKDHEPKIFSNGFENFQVIVESSCYSLTVAKIKLAFCGYHLYQARKAFLWRDLAWHDQYLIGDQLCQKEPQGGIKIEFAKTSKIK